MNKHRDAFHIVAFFMVFLAFTAKPRGDTTMTMQIVSSVFANSRAVPAQFTCDGKNISPPLAWSNVPLKCKSLVLICDDPDVPGGTWLHWISYDIPPTVKSVAENCPHGNAFPGGGKQGMNDFGTIGYGGPCPPSGTHRYFFKLYALDKMLGLPAGKTKNEIEQAMHGHIIEEVQLFGTYSRKGR